MKNKFLISSGGTSLMKDDVNALGSHGTLDDDVLEALFNMQPNTPFARGVIPISTLVAPTSTGITVGAFRAVIGDGVNHTCISAFSDTTTFTIATNSSGSLSRWDLVYASVTVASNSTTRNIKNTTTQVVTATSVSNLTTATVSVGIVQGTPSIGPSIPSTPTDTVGVSTATYYIPLALIFVFHGYTTGTPTPTTAICINAPVLPVSRRTGASTVAPASMMFASNSGWLGALRDPTFLPSSMVGSESRIIGILLVGTGAPNITSGGIIDNSVDWRNRLFRLTVFAHTSDPFTWSAATGGTTIPKHGSDAANLAVGNQFGVFGGQSFQDDSGFLGTGGSVISILKNSHLSMIPAGGPQTLILYADSTTGALRCQFLNFLACNFVIWLEASAPFTNW